MNTPPMGSTADRRSGDEDSNDRADRELDVVLALDPLDEALDVAFLAIRCAQQAARAVPDAALPARVREDWRINNVLVRQAIRLVDERVQELSKAIKRLSRSG